LNYAAYEKWVQDYLVQATYWHDPLHESAYIEKSTFLADINNENNRNEDYVTNLQNLTKYEAIEKASNIELITLYIPLFRFIMVRFNNDTIVQPIDSQWFGFYTPGQDQETQRMEETNLYLEDKLGLKQMNENGQLVFLDVDGDHLQFSREWFKENVIQYLKEGGN
jgi:palmitoyl-protein thioesterase